MFDTALSVYGYPKHVDGNKATHNWISKAKTGIKACVSSLPFTKKEYNNKNGLYISSNVLFFFLHSDMMSAIPQGHKRQKREMFVRVTVQNVSWKPTTC